MSWLLIVLLIVAFAFFVWQLALFIRDLVKKIKEKKSKKLEDNQQMDADRKDEAK